MNQTSSGADSITMAARNLIYFIELENIWRMRLTQVCPNFAMPRTPM